MKPALALWLALAGPALASDLQVEVQQITAPEGPTFNFLGRSVAISGDWMVVGDHSAEAGLGMVCFYRRTPTGWALTQMERAADVGTVLGWSVDIDGGVCVVGAPEMSLWQTHTGRAFVYELEGEIWRLAQILQPEELVYGNGFGLAVAVSGKTLAVTAMVEVPPVKNHGAVFVFERQVDGWVKTQRISPELTKEVRNGYYYAMGGSLAMSGRYLVAGCTFGHHGAAYVYEQRPKGWTQVAILKDPTPESGDTLGKSVAVDGTTIVVGEPMLGHSWPYIPGRALVFEQDESGNWPMVQELEASDGYAGNDYNDAFGFRVAIEGEHIAVSASNGKTVGELSGTVYLFQRQLSGKWKETRRLVPSDPSKQHMGESLALDGGTVAAGSTYIGPYNSSGGAYLFGIELGDAYCPAVPNSTGEPAHLAVTGSDAVADQDLTFTVHDCPPGTHGAFLMGDGQASVAQGDGVLCVGPRIARLTPVAATGSLGVVLWDLDFADGVLADALLAGTTWYFQFSFADPLGGPKGFNFSNAVALTLE